MSTLLMSGRSVTGDLLPRAFETIGRLAAAFAAEIEARRSARALMAADDATLADLGVSRGAIEHAVRTGRGEG
jgi:uncharacterized protein YjiS (DUF1127 family)